MEKIAINCTGFTKTQKQYVQEAFFKMGCKWSTPGYQNLDAYGYAVSDGRTIGRFTYPIDKSDETSFSDYKFLTFNELMELADLPLRRDENADDAPSDEIHATLTERGNNYGSFESSSELMQGLKQVAHSHPNWQSMPPAQREAIDMILHKIGRAINGNHEYRDNWIDIEGYARLVSCMLK